jgi:flagellum-specific ATP synthase
MPWRRARSASRLGEPPASKGYTPSASSPGWPSWSSAPGNFETGSITAFYTVLMEGDDQQDPLVDAVRSLLDGHIVLSRAGGRGLVSARRGARLPEPLMPVRHQRRRPPRAGRGLLRRLMATSHALRGPGPDRRLQGRGSDPDLDRALRARSALRAFVTQQSPERVSFSDCIRNLAALAAEV